MRAFVDLFTRLDRTTRTNTKVAALADYFRQAEPADAAWALALLTGSQKFRRSVRTAQLRQWGAERAGIPDWLLAESYEAVGDLAETLALLVGRPAGTALWEQCPPLHQIVEDDLQQFPKQEEPAIRARLAFYWNLLDAPSLFVFHKLITGGFRVGVSKQLVIRALAQVGQAPESAITHRLAGTWTPTPEAYQNLFAPENARTDLSKPYPYFLAYPLEAEPETLGPVSDWQAEWKWDGIRSQLIRRQGEVYLWSRGDELITEGFPELQAAGTHLPEGTVLDGELLVWPPGAGQPAPFTQLQKRINRKKVGPKMLRELPARILVYDLLEWAGADVRAWPLQQRRARLESLLAEAGPEDSLQLSPVVEAVSWKQLAELRATSRSRGAEGLMLKAHGSPYRSGRKRGEWWKWKVEPYTIDAVLIYAQRGHGRRSSLYTDYTFALWQGDQLVPFAKAYSGLTDKELTAVDRFIRQNTRERFGPVRTVKPELVMEIAFENIQPSNRHKCGVAVRFPRINRWRTDKKPEDANTLAELKALAGAGL